MVNKNRQPYKVSEKDYLLLQKFNLIKEKHGIKNDDQLLQELTAAQQRQTEFGREQMEYERNLRLKDNARKVKSWERQIAFKRGQLKANEIVEKDETVKSGYKPAWLIENEIDVLELEVEKTNDESEKLREEQEKAKGDASG